uniref:Leukotriene B4 receptor 2a n=1 Tax=Cyclopterus lumpus TaxID=8103 RepID=A0A8C2XF37_CYCLU
SLSLSLSLLSGLSLVNTNTGTTVGALILSLVFLLGFPGNLFIIWSVLARARRHSVTTLLILNLAIADGSLMALTPFFVVYLVMKRWVFGNVMCKLLFYLCLVNMYASIQLIMLMSIYRLVAVLWPQRVTVITGRKAVLRGLALRHIKRFSTPLTSLLKHCPHADLLTFRAQVVLQYTLELVLGFLVPYAVIVVSYICILRRLRQTKFRRRIRSEKLILAIVLTFCLFWLPYHVINMVQVRPVLLSTGRLNTIWHKSRAVTSSIAFISSCANPVLYFFAGKSYIRREGLAFMARLFEGTGLDSATRKSRQNTSSICWSVLKLFYFWPHGGSREQAVNTTMTLWR